MSTYGPSVSEVGAFAPGIIEFTWIPDPEVIAQELIATSGRLEDRQAPLRISKQIAIDDMGERFATKTSPEGDKWAPWAPMYAPIAERVNVGGILQRTDAMRQAAMAEGAYPVTNDSVFFETGGLPDYWTWMQEGTGGRVTRVQVPITGPLGNIIGTEEAMFTEGAGRGKSTPPRPFVGLSFDAELKIIETFDQWFDSAIALGISSKGKPFARHALRGPGGRFVSAGS